MSFLMNITTKAIFIGLASLATTTAVNAAQSPVEFDLQGHDEFIKSLGDKVTTRQPKTSEEAKQILTKVYNDKLQQHVATLHYEKGVTCITCHDQQRQGGPDWMTAVTNPAMKKNCGDCHTTQAFVFSKTAAHKKMNCMACHMPNAEPGLIGAKDGSLGPTRRLHTYKINVSPTAHTFVQAKDGAWELAKDKDGHAFVDLMISCGRAAPGDYTVCEGRGCHSPSTSKLDPGLIYQNQDEIYGEVLKWQKPVKEGYEKITLGVERIRKLLEVTKLSYEDQTQIRLLLDKAEEVSDLIKKDGSWGAHAARYLQDRVKSALGYLNQAQTILDKGGY